MELLKQKSLSFVRSKISSKWYFLLVPLTMISIMILFSFRPKTESNLIQKNISFQVNGQSWESVKIADATILLSEQTQNIFAKTLNINAIDAKGSSMDISIFDVFSAEQGECLTLGKYFGLENTTGFMFGLFST